MNTAALPSRPRSPARAVGEMIRTWRLHRRMSQMDLALQADISTRHLSCVETGRAAPSRAMVMHLAERLDVPLRERNALLAAAGFAPLYAERPLDHPAMAAARAAVEQVLEAHEPWPALAVDRHWTLLAGNKMVEPLLQDVDAALLQGPVNVLRLSLHPGGLAPRIANLPQWRHHLFHRLGQQIAASGDPVLVALLAELRAYPVPTASTTGEAAALAAEANPIAVPLQLRTPVGLLNFISTTTVFGTPVDITLSELALETFFPADRATAETLRAMAA